MSRRAGMGVAVVALSLSAGCPSVREEPGGNGEDQQLDLSRGTAPADVDPACAPVDADPTRTSCASGRCWMLSLEPTQYRLFVTRKVDIYDCGGFGDCLHDWALRPLEADHATVTVAPADAAEIGDVQVCDDVVAFELDILQPGALTLEVSAGDWRDRWTLQADAACVPFDCDAFVHDAAAAPACCGFAP